MTLEKCYELLGGNFREVLGRMRREALVEKFLLKFPNDPSYGELTAALGRGDREEAFRAAHTIKGICSNLGFTKLYESDSLLTEALRHGRCKEYSALFQQVQKDYERVIEVIGNYCSRKNG